MIRLVVRGDYEFNISDFNEPGKAFGEAELDAALERGAILILDDATIADMKEKRARDRARDEAARLEAGWQGGAGMSGRIMRVLAMLALACITCVGSMLARKGKTARRAQSVRLLYWNIQNGMWAGQTDDYRRFTSWVDSLKPDVCVWCEAQSIWRTNSDKALPREARQLPGRWPELAARYGHT